MTVILMLDLHGPRKCKRGPGLPGPYNISNITVFGRVRIKGLWPGGSEPGHGGSSSCPQTSVNLSRIVIKVVGNTLQVTEQQFTGFQLDFGNSKFSTGTHSDYRDMKGMKPSASSNWFISRHASLLRQRQSPSASSLEPPSPFT
jgi:hypothetical protein